MPRWVAFLLVASLVLVPAAAEPSTATFPGRNGKIAFVSYRGGLSELYVMGADGRGVKRVLKGIDATSPTWSPDGRTIAFGSNRPGERQGLSTVASAGGRVRKLTDHSRETRDGRVSWSPDGKRIAFAREEATSRSVAIYIMNARGGGLRRLAADAARPAWSPDGRSIAFVGAVRGAKADVYVMRADGSDRRQLTRGTGNDHSPDWSPDGRRIAFFSDRDGNQEIYVMNADGSRQVRLTRKVGHDQAPVWSPDGRRIVFSGEPDFGRQANIYVMNADGSRVKRLTTGTQGDLDPSWQRPPPSRSR